MPSKSSPLVSVVTPAYNEELFLRECIESVLAQTYSNWDYTIVDNASTDRTGDIAREYAARDRRIRIVRNPATVPVVVNLNIACQQRAPNAKYLKIVAGDDWIFPRCIEDMVDLAEAHPSIAMVGAYRVIGERLQAEGLPFGETVASGRDVCRNFLDRGIYPFGVPTSLLYRANLIREKQPFFNESYLEADLMACLEYLQTEDFGFVHQVLTFMREQGGTTHTQVKDNNLYLGQALRCVVMYGPKYFDEADLKTVIAGHLRSYYEFLGGQVLKRRDARFWSLHESLMAEQGYPLNRARLAAHAILSLIQDAANRIRRHL
jgi:glycosyltransferase involved in cell wall biosynthesis